LPLQQLLIPVSAGTSGSGGSAGIQQVISVLVPVCAAAATGPVQLLATPGGQIINVANIVVFIFHQLPCFTELCTMFLFFC